MYVLKTKENKYIWAKKGNLEEWCVSLKPYLFNFDEAEKLLSIIKDLKLEEVKENKK